MFFTSFYKGILDKLPTAVLVYNKKGRVIFTNVAFREHFSPENSAKGDLKSVIGCAAFRGECGKGDACELCQMKRLLQSVFVAQEERFEDVRLSVRSGGEVRQISLRMRALPLKKGLCLGLVESVYERELAKELTSAQNIQQRLLPVGKEAGGVPYNYMFIPCREIGGDLPDVYELDLGGKTRDTFGVIADVSGKGIAAGMLSSFFKAGFDRSEPSPAKAIAKLNVKFRELNLDEKAYITVAATRIDSDNRKIYYSIAGHNAPLLLRSGQGVSEIEMSAPPVSNWFSDFYYEDRELEYEKGDILVLLTDGVTESRNAADEQFGIERVENILLRAENSRHFIDLLRAELAAFCGSFDDDITAIAFDL